MKRDMDLVREILLYIENQDINSGNIEPIRINGYTLLEILEHVKLMENYGLVKDCDYDMSGNTCVRTITWEGYDYLDKIRDNTLWKETKDVIKEKGLPLVFETIKTISTALVTAAAEGIVNSIIKSGGNL